MRSPTGAGLFEEAVLAFNENLNCLIGPRGCGKSTIAEALRYALGQNGTLADVPKQSKDQVDYRDLAFGIQRANLVDTIIEVLYEPKPGERHCLVATYDPKEAFGTEVFTLEGDEKPMSRDAILAEYPVSIYS
jgi:predicted ATP-dependent endonuclease of OLD family